MLWTDKTTVTIGFTLLKMVDFYDLSALAVCLFSTRNPPRQGEITARCQIDDHHVPYITIDLAQCLHRFIFGLTDTYILYTNYELILDDCGYVDV